MPGRRAARATPSQPTPSQPTPSQPTPSQPTPSQPAPGQSTPGQPTRSQHWRALDGLRAFAVLSVMAFHAGVSFVQGGSYGVDVFFPLSGFLITMVLLRERDRTGRTRFRAFYLRRALRLLPALALLTVADVIYSLTWSPHWIRATLPGLFYVWTFLSNWATALHLPYGNTGYIGQTWTLAVEEQFYWLWPLAFVLILRRSRDRSHIAFGLFALALAMSNWRWLWQSHGWTPWQMYWRTDTHCDGLILGCALAFWLASGPAEARGPRRPWLPLTIGAAGLGLAVFRPSAFWLPEGPPFQVGLASCLVIWVLVTRPPRLAARVLGWAPVAYIGRISYGLYLWHFPIYIALMQYQWMLDHPRKYWLAKLVLPFTAAALSYALVEKPFLNLKTRLGERPAPATTTVPAEGGVPAEIGVPAGTEAAVEADVPVPEVAAQRLATR